MSTGLAAPGQGSEGSVRPHRLDLRRRPVLAFGLHLGLATLLFVAGAALVVFGPALLTVATHAADDPAAARAAEELLALHRHFWRLAPAMVLFAVAYGVHAYRRFTGPLVRFRRAFRAVAQGEVPEPLRLRDTDHLYEDLGDLNAMLRALRQRELALRELRRELDAAAAEAGREETDPLRARKRLEQWRELAERAGGDAGGEAP